MILIITEDECVKRNYGWNDVIVDLKNCRSKRYRTGSIQAMGGLVASSESGFIQEGGGRKVQSRLKGASILCIILTIHHPEG